MYSELKRVLTGVILCCSVLQAQDYVPGQMVPEVQCKGDSDYSYVLYLPKDYDPNREEKWPVLFVMSPNGGRVSELRPYVAGADMCDWILAMSIQSKNDTSSANADRAIQSMVNDVFDRFPVNKKRCYASGFSGGARESYDLAARMPDTIIGIIPCGAGGQVNARLLAYGLSGAMCFNRWDTTITFHEQVRKNGVLRFFPGDHKWASSPYFLDAMVWMNGKYFQKRGDEKELAKFSSRLLADIKENRESRLPFAYELCQTLVSIKKAPDVDEGKEILAEMEKDPAVQTYLEALADVDEFAEKHFNTNVMDYQTKKTTPQSVKDSQKLAEKYKDTPYAELMTQLGKPNPN